MGDLKMPDKEQYMKIVGENRRRPEHKALRQAFDRMNALNDQIFQAGRDFFRGVTRDYSGVPALIRAHEKARAEYWRLVKPYLGRGA